MPLPGEDQVHPVTGPVRGTAMSVQAGQSSAAAALRTRVQDEISTVNRQR
ncbi:hypothetical protein [Amycolatopsis sp. NPDC051716]